ncbi:MAG: cell division protein FtsQ/DivIB [Saccharofermentanales bacterium]
MSGHMSRRHHRRRGRRANKISSYVILCVAAVAALILFALPQFYIGEIRISGQRIVTTAEIVEKGGLREGSHLLSGVKGSISEMFSLRHTEAEQLLMEQLPYIKSVEIRSVFPSVLSVALEERVEVAYISIKDGYVIIDADGIALEVLPKDDAIGIPIVEGITVSDIILGAKAQVDKPDYLNQTVILLNAIINAQKDSRTDFEILPSILTIRPVGDNLIFLTLSLPESGDTLSVKTKLTSDLQEDMLWLRFAMQQSRLEGLGSGVLDLTTEQRVFIPDN